MAKNADIAMYAVYVWQNGAIPTAAAATARQMLLTKSALIFGKSAIYPTRIRTIVFKMPIADMSNAAFRESIP